MSPPPKLSRRGVTLGGIGVAVTAVVAGAVYEVPRLFKHRVTGEYAGLVNLLDEPDQAAIVGRSLPAFASDIGPYVPDFAFGDLKKRLAKKSLRRLLAEDSAGPTARIVEADGWVMPLALAELCVLAAQST